MWKDLIFVSFEKNPGSGKGGVSGSPHPKSQMFDSLLLFW